MNEQRKTKKLQAYINLFEKRLAGMNKGSRILLKIASSVLLAGIAMSAFLVVATLSGLMLFDNQVQMVQWLIIYASRVWVMLICGALILDYLKGR